jgi:hypothetical protein
MAALPVVPGEPALAPKVARPAARLHLVGKEAAQQPPRARTTLSPVTDSELARVRRANGGSTAQHLKRLVIGIERDAAGTVPLPASSDLQWIAVDDGHAARMTVTSPEAAAMRVSFALAGVPANVEMVFFGSARPERLLGPIRVGDIADRTAPWWSPVTEGEAQTVEIFVPGPGDPRSLPFHAVSVSHLFAGPSSRFEKRVQDIGLAGSCNVDLACSSLNATSAFHSVAEAVAQMVFTDGAFTALCTGTLVNDTDGSTQAPWFYSANHCFENDSPPYKTPAQMQAVASSLDTLWYFEAASCGSSTPSTAYQQLSGGATYVYNNADSDVIFLRLNDTPPIGAFYAGWDPNPISPGTAIATVHHPEGDLKKVSQGTVLGFSAPGVAGGSNQFVQVRYSSGTTEPGSSGAGLFTTNGSQYLLRGGLWGGTALCSNPTGTDDYSRFDQAYPALAAYLSPAAAPATDYTDLWWNPDESGWGLSLTQHASRNIFGVWYTYAADGTRTWYVLPGGTWTSGNTFSGTLYATTGPALDGAFDPGQVTRTPVGTGTLDFIDANHGTWTFTVDGVSGSKVIQRQPY